jgi:hypothetical protein
VLSGAQDFLVAPKGQLLLFLSPSALRHAQRRKTDTIGRYHQIAAATGYKFPVVSLIGRVSPAVATCLIALTLPDLLSGWDTNDHRSHAQRSKTDTIGRCQQTAAATGHKSPVASLIGRVSPAVAMCLIALPLPDLLWLRPLSALAHLSLSARASLHHSCADVCASGAQ